MVNKTIITPIQKDMLEIAITDLESTLKKNFPNKKNNLSVESLIVYLNQFHKIDKDIQNFFNNNSKKDYITQLYQTFPNKFKGERIKYLRDLTYDLAQEIPIYDIIKQEKIYY